MVEILTLLLHTPMDDPETYCFKASQILENSPQLGGKDCGYH